MASSSGIEDFGTDLHVLRGEPAPHALVLQVSVQSMDKLVVLRRVADEARVVLDRLAQQRGQVADQLVRQANAAQEGKRQKPGAL
jgi:hypothetical protein